jgi:undecaprenyl-diphosphatase
MLTQAITFGIIQGLTEFLPVSSSAHLTLLPFFTGWQDPGLAFDVALHWGTLMAVLLYFWKDVGQLVQGVLGFAKGKRDFENKFPFMIALATIPGVISGVLVEKWAETIFRSPQLIMITLCLGALALYAADRYGIRKLTLSEFTWTKAFIVGLLQCLALMPGVSRSGITISTALALGFQRTDAVRFSFFLAIPITAGAGLLKIGYLLTNLNNIHVITALVASAVSGMAAIHLLLRYTRNKSFTPFVIYRFILAGAILIVNLK